MKTVEEILENKWQIEGLRIGHDFFWINYFEEESETFYAFQLDDNCIIDYEFTVEELANREDVIFYEYKEV